MTRSPSCQWTAQQIRNATPFGEGRRFIIRDRDDTFGPEFDRAARAVGARVIKTAVRTPDMNAVCERFLGSVRRECLDQVIVLNDVTWPRSFPSTLPFSTTGVLINRWARMLRGDSVILRPPVRSLKCPCSAGCTTTIDAPREACPIDDIPGLDRRSSQHRDTGPIHPMASTHGHGQKWCREFAIVTGPSGHICRLSISRSQLGRLVWLTWADTLPRRQESKFDGSPICIRS